MHKQEAAQARLCLHLSKCHIVDITFCDSNDHELVSGLDKEFTAKRPNCSRLLQDV